jgi:hypothetical protein
MKHELSFSDFRFLDFSSLEFDEYSVFVSKLPLYSAGIAEEANYRFLVRELDRISWWTESLSMRTAHLEKGLWRYEAVLEFSGSSLRVAEVKFLRSLQERLHNRTTRERNWLDYDITMEVLTERATNSWDTNPIEGRKTFIRSIAPSYAEYETWDGCGDLHLLNYADLCSIELVNEEWRRRGVAYAITTKFKKELLNHDWNRQNVRV